MAKKSAKHAITKAAGIIVPRTMRFGGSATLQASGTAADPTALPRFRVEAYTGSVMRLPGWPLPVIVDLQGQIAPATAGVQILKDHDNGKTVGHSEQLVINASGISLEAIVSGTGPAATEVVGNARNGFKWQTSIGLDIEQVDHLEAGQTARVNGQTLEGPLLIVRAGTLREVSFVALGGDVNSSATLAAAALPANSENPMTFEQWLADQGFDPATISEIQKKNLLVSFEAQAAEETDDGVVELGTTKVAARGKAKLQAAASTNHGGANLNLDPQAEAIAATRAENVRITQIRRLCASATGEHLETEEKAIGEGWTVEKTELTVLRASRAKAPAAHIHHGRDNSPLVLEAALSMAGKLPGHEKMFDDKTLQAANTQYKDGIGLQQILLEAAWANGFTGRSFRGNIRNVLQAAFSTQSLPGILSNNVNKFLLAGYMSVESVWRRIASIGSASDFKTITSYRLTGGMEFEEVGPTGELKHGKVGEESYTNKVRTYGKIYSITRTDLKNDDLGALTSIPRMQGRGAALKVNLVFWTEFLENAANFFGAGNKNYAEGAATPDTRLGVDGLSYAEKTFLLQTDPDGNAMAIDPRILLVGPSQKTLAETLMASLELRDNTANTKTLTKNPHAGKWDVACSTYLENARIPNYSTTKWWLLADPQDMPVIEIRFLDGQEQPTIESAEADFKNLGIEMRGYFDFGVAKQNPRGGVEMKGAA